MKPKRSNAARYGADYVREAARRHEERRKQASPVWPALARQVWRTDV